MKSTRPAVYFLAWLLSLGTSLVSVAFLVDAMQRDPLGPGTPAIGDASKSAGGAPTSKALGPPDPTDANPPAGTILSPLPGTWQTYSYVYLRVWFSDPDGIANSSLYMAIDGRPLTIYWTATESDVWLSTAADGLSDGTHNAEAGASDQLGNGPTVLRWSFSKDATPPRVEITSPVGNPVLANGSVVLAWTGSDTESGIDHYQVKLDDGPPIDVGNVTSFPFNGLEVGVHYFYVRAFDVAGNSDYNFEVAIGTVLFDVPPPPPPPPSPANTTIAVTLSGDTPSWALALLVLSAAELGAILVLAWGDLGRGRRDRSNGGRHV